MKSKLKREIKLLEELISLLKVGYGKKPCKEYNPWCSNCVGHLLIGLLESELESARDWQEEIK